MTSPPAGADSYFGIHAVNVSVLDQERSLRFYVVVARCQRARAWTFPGEVVAAIGQRRHARLFPVRRELSGCLDRLGWEMQCRSCSPLRSDRGRT